MIRIRSARWTAATAATLFLLAAGCGGGGGGLDSPPNESDARISIVNDPSALAARVTDYTDPDTGVSEVPVPVDADSPSIGYAPVRMPASPAPLAPASVSLTLLAEARPPTVGGILLQATSIAIRGTKVAVSYNNAGLPHVGGIDVYNIASGSKTQLKSQALFSDAKVNAVTLDDSYAYVAGADNTDSPAHFEVLRLVGANLTLAGNNRTPLPSYAGTCAFASPAYVYATSGDNGALSVYSPGNTLTPLNAIPLRDARWVDASGGVVAIAQGTPGTVSVFDENAIATASGPTAAFPFPGGNVPESKSTVQVVNGKAIVAAGDNGVQVISLRTGNVLAWVPPPDNNALGLPKSVVVANAVTVDTAAGGTLMFISNGEAGVYVARSDTPFSQDWGETPRAITVVGKLRFASLQSANHVSYSGGLLIVAAGTGGVKIVLLR
jgi:hypothetical protein